MINDTMTLEIRRIMYEILVDVSLDVDVEYAESKGVRYVAMDYMIGDEERHCTAPETLEFMHTYYDRLRNTVPTRTSQVTPFQYKENFEPYVKEGKSILYISLSSGLSDTYQSAQMAVKMLEEDYENVNIEVVDSLGATGGMGILTESACENREKGMSLKENADWLREHAANINYWFKVEDLMYLKRGGRVSAATAVIGTALNIKPVLTINPEGKLDTVAKKRGSKLAMKWMLDSFAANCDLSIGKSVYISCADCPEDAEVLKNMVLEVKPEAEVKITSLSPIIGAHTGPDMISLIYYGAKRVREA